MMAFNTSMAQQQDGKSIAQDLTTKSDVEPQKQVGYRYPGLALLFSAIYPGGGQIYNKQLVKGIIMAALYTTGLITYYAIQIEEGYSYYSGYYEESWPTGKIVALSGMVAVWLYSVIDAPITAAKINRRGGSVYIELTPSYEFVQTYSEKPASIVGGKFTFRF